MIGKRMARRLTKTQRALNWLSTLGAVLVLVVLATAVNTWSSSPWDGMVWSDTTQRVLSLSAGGPADEAGIEVGDLVLAIDGVPFARRFPLYDADPGDKIVLTVERDGVARDLPLVLGQAPVSFLALRLCNLAVAGLFLVFGLAFSVGDQFSLPASVFALFYQLLAVVIVTGSLSALQIGWAGRGFYMSLAMLIPCSLFMASNFPVERTERWLAWMRVAALAAGLALVLPLTMLRLETIALSASGHVLRQSTLLALLVAIGVSCAVIAQSFRRARDAVARAAIRVSALGLAVAIVPLVALYMLPRMIVGHGLVSAEVALLFLAALPLYHGYAITRRRFDALERVLLPLSSGVLSGLIFVTTMLASVWVVSSVWPTSDHSSIVAGMVVGAIVLAVTNVPVISGARRLVHHAFYGQAYDFQSVVSEMSRDLAQAVGRDEMGGLVEDTL